MHTVLIALHATTGGVALLVGFLAHRGRALFDTYFWALVASILFLVAAIVAEWGDIGWGARLLFCAFVVLGMVMIALAARARGLLPDTGRPPSRAYLDLVGFTLIALFDAFIVIVVLNAGAPVLVVVGSGVLVAVAGHFALRAAKAGIPVSARP